MALVRLFKMVIVEKWTWLLLWLPRFMLCATVITSLLMSFTILHSTSIPHAHTHLFWRCTTLALVVDIHMFFANIFIINIYWCCMRMRKTMTSSLTILGALLLWRNSSTMILWFRLHWIVVQWIVNTTTFIWCSLRSFFWPLAIITFCYTKFIIMRNTFVCKQPYSCENWKQKCMVQYISIWNLINMKKHVYSSCQRFYMKSKAFLRGGKIALKVVNGLYEKQRLLAITHALENYIICFLARLIISQELDVNLCCCCLFSPKSYRQPLHYKKNHSPLWIWNMTTMFHILITNQQTS